MEMHFVAYCGCQMSILENTVRINQVQQTENA
ncbi:hypothetical protein T4E_5098 [Trichinella pseudospiralis]|uniref:Uncharacterized protein n=1 Tax=Trichinella pseudospiralis TaxID=6337 RepID=A0A0V0XDQ9_TRIPS|nr:hypothetical protein T4E_5098 [Trichinella pseudospiralis]